MFLVNPVLEYILNIFNNGEDVDHWYNNLSIDKIKETRELNSYNYDEITYYYEKFKYLELHEQLDSYNIEDDINFEIEENDIISSIANSNDIAFEVTEQCNLNCVYCVYNDFYQGFEKREDRNLDFESAKKLLDFLFKMSEEGNSSYIKELDIGFYGGEPLMNFKLIKKIVDYALSIELKRTNIAFSMTSNCLLIKKYCDFLQKHNFSLLLSLDGDKDSNSYRVLKSGNNPHHIIFGNIQFIKNKYPLFFEKNVQFNVVLHDKNNVNDIYSYFYNNFNKIPSIIELSDAGLKKEKMVEYEKMYRKFDENLISPSMGTNDLELLNPSSIMVTDFIIHNTDNIFTDYNDLLFDIKRKKFPTGTCMPFEKKLFLSSKGLILPCENVPHKFKLGTVDSHGVHINYKEITDLYQNYYKMIFKQCKHCYSQLNCSQCFMQLSDDEYNGKCKMFSSYNDYVSYLSFIQGNIEKKPLLYVRAMCEITIS